MGGSRHGLGTTSTVRKLLTSTQTHTLATDDGHTHQERSLEPWGRAWLIRLRSRLGDAFFCGESQKPKASKTAGSPGASRHSPKIMGLLLTWTPVSTCLVLEGLVLGVYEPKWRDEALRAHQGGYAKLGRAPAARRNTRRGVNGRSERTCSFNPTLHRHLDARCRTWWVARAPSHRVLVTR